MLHQLKLFSLLLVMLFSCSCNGQVTTKSANKINTLEPIEEIVSHQYDAGDVVTNGYLDRFGNMWFTTLKEGGFKYDGQYFDNITVEDGLCSNHVNTVMEDQEGLLWFGTDKGLCVYNGSDYKNISLPTDHDPPVSPVTGLPSRKTQEVLWILQDKEGIYWIGTIATGAYRYDGKTFSSYLRYEGRIQPDSVYNNVIQSMVEDNEGNIWFTSQTHGGITKYDGEDFTNYNLQDGLPDDMIFSSYKDTNGDLWFGTLDKGLISYKGGNFSYFKEFDWQTISCFYETQSGELWVGSFRGESVKIFDGEKFHPVTFDPQKKLIELRFITEDKDGNIWFGGRYGLLWMYDGEKLQDFTQLKRQ